MSISEKVKKLRALLIDKYAEIRGIDDDLLILSLTKSLPFNISDSFKKSQKEKYGSTDYQRLEFLGDSVLELITSEILFNNFNLFNPHLLTEYKSKLVKNTSLYCFINSKDLCSLIISSNEIGSKNCSDLFESIVGAIYYHLRTHNYPNTYDYIKKWLVSVWDFENVLNYLITHPDEKDICNVLSSPKPLKEKSLQASPPKSSPKPLRVSSPKPSLKPLQSKSPTNKKMELEERINKKYEEYMREYQSK